MEVNAVNQPISCPSCPQLKLACSVKLNDESTSWSMIPLPQESLTIGTYSMLFLLVIPSSQAVLRFSEIPGAPVASRSEQWGHRASAVLSPAHPGQRICGGSWEEGSLIWLPRRSLDLPSSFQIITWRDSSKLGMFLIINPIIFQIIIFQIRKRSNSRLQATLGYWFCDTLSSNSHFRMPGILQIWRSKQGLVPQLCFRNPQLLPSNLT